MIIVAAAAPLGAMIGNVPIGIILGNGAGLPIMFLIAGLLIACLAAGYLAMNSRLNRAGGFAALVGVGLSPALGLGTAFATGLAYLAGTVALAVGTGYFTALILGGFGLVLPWWAWSAVALLLVLTVGRRAASVSAKALLLLMVAEFAILLVLDVAILVQHGLSALPLDVFSPDNVFSGSIGPAIMIGFTSFIGIESAILYSKEAKSPERTIPRATYFAIATIVVFYVLSSWLLIGSVGTATVVEVASELQGDFVFGIAAANAGNIILVLMQVFFCTSLLACLLALHNATVRYLHSLAQQHALPRGLAVIHPRHGAPSRASDMVVALTALVLLVSALTGADPYLTVGTSLTGVFTIGVIGIQALVALAVVVYFRRVRSTNRWSSLWAPLLGGIGVLAAVILIALNYPVLTGTSSLAVNLLPLVIPTALIAGVLVGRRAARRGTDIDLGLVSE